MNCPDCDREVHGGIACSCGWVRPGASKIVFRNTETPQPTHGITREQFGLTLYEAVRLVGEIKQLRIMRGRVAMGELKPSDYMQREEKAIDQLRTCVVQLSPDDVVELTNEYPWVATL